MPLQRWFNKTVSWWRLLLHRSRIDEALHEELQFHLDAKTELNVAKGMTPEAARRAALIELGGMEQVEEKVQAIRTGAWLEIFLQDVRFGLRIFRKSPGFTITAVAILALGIGANSAIFSIMNGLMLHTLPVRDPGSLVELLHQYPGEPAFNGFSWETYEILREQDRAFTDLIVASVNTFNVHSDTLQSETVFGGGVGGNFFQSLGLNAAAGRLIGIEDVHMGYHEPVAVVSWSFWKTRFGLDPGIVSKKIVVNDVPVTIIGVAPRGFYGLSEEARQDIWLPVSLGPSSGWGFGLLGRLKPGVSKEQARAEMAVLFQRVVNAPDAGPFVKKMQLRVESAAHGVSTPLRNTLSTPVIVLMAMVGLLLLLACANLAGLLLSRAASRQHEMALRASLGAGRARLIQQTLTESWLLSMMGTALGVLLAFFGARGLIRIFTSGREIIGLPVNFEALSRPDWHVLFFTGTIAITTGLLFGVLPAIRACRHVSAPRLRETAQLGESRNQRLFGKSLVVSQVAVSVVLLTSASLFVGYLLQLRSLNPGFMRDHLLLFTLDAENSGYEAAQYIRLSEQLLARLETIPGAQRAALSLMSPMQGPGASASAFQLGHPDNGHNVLLNNVSPSYFETYGTQLLFGRYFSAQDHDQPLAILNQAATRECFGNANPLGKHLTLSHVTLTKGETNYEIVGVVADAKYNDIQQASPPTIYRGLAQTASIGSQLAVRTTIDPGAMASQVREIESSTLKTVPIVRVTTMNDQIDASIVPERLLAMLSGWFAAVGALLASVGLYGLMAYTVTRRTHEIGVRIAMGAARSDVMGIIVCDALWTVCGGLALGTPLAFWAQRVASSLVQDLPVANPVPVMFSGVVMILMGSLAALIPARRAMQVDPIVALRYE